MIERLFKLSENNTNVRTEVLAGVTTFLTMAYIIFVQPAVLSGKMFGTDTGMDFGAITTTKMLLFVFVFLFMLTFDAIGTLIGVCEQAGFMRNNKLPRAKQAMVSDAIGTVAGAALGTSTVTSFIESAAGVEAGGQTGLSGLVVAVLFLFALFFNPLIAMIGGYPPITAPALTIVGAMMMQNVTKIEWKDYTESIPAFLFIIGIPLSYSIADGLAPGFISYAVIKAFSGRGREISWLT
jgi:AGZA family xanthine/uracil permease-like MFS transporter